MVSRRDLLGVGLTAGAVGVMAGCAPLAARVRSRAPKEAFALPNAPTTAAVRVLGRAGFGHKPGDLQAYAADGHEATLNRFFLAEAQEDLALKAQIARLDVFRVDAVEMEDIPRAEVLRQLRQAAILRAVYGANPLFERMCDFWSDHFNIYGQKEADAWRKGRDQEVVIREHALGNFHEMLYASARSPAMLGYLDNELNRKGAPNENYARELMELHTMGVDGGYTQHDIQEVARCFTGWTTENRFLRPRGTYRFDPDRHDEGDKYVLGQWVKNGGEKEGVQVLEMVAKHPATARHLARKLCTYFLGHRNPKLEAETAAAYTSSNGDIKKTIRPLLFSKELVDGPPILKRPMDLLASSLRALDGTTDGWTNIQEHLSKMGQEPYEWPMPDGFPMKTVAWSGSMLPRWQFAFALAGGAIVGTSLEGDDLPVQVRLKALYGHEPSKEVVAAVERDGLGMAIAAPEFQWR